MFAQAICFVIPVFLLQAVSITAAEPKNDFVIRTKRNNDSVIVHVTNRNAVFDVHSPSGISQLVIERRTQTWPKTMKLRLHLRGLEHLQVTNGQLTIQATISSSDTTATPHQSLTTDEQTPLSPEHPSWLKIQRQMLNMAGTGREEPFYDIILPPGLFSSNPTSLTVDWIDFYR